MNLIEMFALAVGLSMDAVAVAICTGLTMRRATAKKATVVGLYFGFFQAIMPLIGYSIATRFAEQVVAYDHWIAFGLLAFLGVRMIVESFEREGCPDRECPVGTCKDRECPGGKRPDTREASLKPAAMLPLAVATSIDALAVGVSLAFLQVNILQPILLIGITTFALSAFGVRVGNIFGTGFKSKAELVGGIMLVLIGSKILVEHLGLL
ncbi:MAG TPA: manganese efflux pump [Firmicutes bacterium]|nr:manganese efflux pump [Bacillota bacterium]